MARRRDVDSLERKICGVRRGWGVKPPTGGSTPQSFRAHCHGRWVVPFAGVLIHWEFGRGGGCFCAALLVRPACVQNTRRYSGRLSEPSAKDAAGTMYWSSDVACAGVDPQPGSLAAKALPVVDASGSASGGSASVSASASASVSASVSSIAPRISSYASSAASSGDGDCATG